MRHRKSNTSYLLCLLSVLANSSISYASAEKKPDKKADAAKGEAAVAAAAANAQKQRELYEPSTKYRNSWIKIPGITGRNVFDDDRYEFKPERGVANVVFFLASWCEPCQKITPEMVALERKYKNLPVKFVYVFTSDTLQDAQGFAKEYKVTSGVMATHEVLRDYHGPELPTIYVGDRHNWLAKRTLKADDDSVKELDQFLALITNI